MDYFYSKSTNSFYPTEYPAIATKPVIPEDVVRISETDWHNLITASQNNKILTADENGYPMLVDRDDPLPTIDELAAED